MNTRVLLWAFIALFLQLALPVVALAEQEDLDNYYRSTSTKNAGVDLYGY